MNKDMQKLIEQGFEGFKTVRELMISCRDIPKEMGVYVVLREKNERPEILEKRPFDCLEEKYPSYSKTELEKGWVEGTQIVYIGKAGGFGQKTGLHKRLSTYIRFGKGKKTAHGGGRSVWQLSDALDFVVCWRILSDEEPCCVESDMIANFCKQHDGKRPFANRRD
ncbi:MAG: hypothetical protein J6O23_00190 [Prevotella sp.]|nr:hypothetical protein [Prevotella sp.]